MRLEEKPAYIDTVIFTRRGAPLWSPNPGRQKALPLPKSNMTLSIYLGTNVINRSLYLP